MSLTGRIDLRLAATALAASLILVACGSAETDDSSAAAPSTAASAVSPPSSESAAPSGKGSAQPEPAVPAVPAILDFSGKTVSGATFEGASVAGKPVVLWFWAPWCPVCRSQAPAVQKLVADYGDDLAVIGVGSLDSGSAIAGFAEDYSGPQHLSDPDGDLWKRFKVSEQSSFVVLDAAGNEVLRTGYNDDDKLDDAVARLVG